MENIEITLGREGSVFQPDNTAQAAGRNLLLLLYNKHRKIYN